MKKRPAYDPAKIEKKWQKKWAASKIYRSKESADKPKFYTLDMFPYPSGEGLHVGHPKGYIATDIVSRMKRMQGMNVLHPMGFDAFGLPAENYALKTKTNPTDSVAKNVERYKKQLELLGFDYDWSREINTTDPKFYKWTQWIFLQLFKKGLAYESSEPINWCPSCKTGLANEDVENGRCERCVTLVEKRPMRQWVLRITDYAERMLKDLDVQTLPNGDIFETLPNGEFGITHMNEDVPGRIRLDKPFVPRNSICAFVEHWSDGSFIALKWKKVDWMTPITGGIEKGQTDMDAALAEIREETGYKNLKLVNRLSGQYHSTFFHPPKDENRVGHFTSFHFKLNDDERDMVVAEEQAKHEIVWISRNKVRDLMTAEGSKLGWDLVMHGKPQHKMQPLLDWPEHIKEAQRNWIGRSEGAEIDFRITMAKDKPRFLILHGFEGSAKTNFIPWLKAELEKRGHEVEAPELPNSFSPSESEQVDYVLKHCKLDERTAVIGHSLGAVVAMKAIMKLNKPVSSLTIVAAAIDPNFAGMNDLRKYSKNFNWKYDYEQIQRLTGNKIGVISDTREKTRGKYLKHLSGELKAYLMEVESQEEHFTATEEPAILKMVTPLIPVFTTRPDTIFGVTYLVLAPEHPWVGELATFIENKAEVQAYIERAKGKTEIDRTDATKEKTGVELKNIRAVNPANGEEVPVWIADYVLADYGTGAVMAVPAHDERDWEFAKKFGLPIKQVIMPEFGHKRDNEEFRDGSCAVVFDPVTQKYAVTEDEKGFYRLCGGGIDKGEDYKTCAIRETAEESGLYDLKSIDLIGEVTAHYHNSLKNVNRVAHSNCYVAILNSTQTKESGREAHEKNFKLKWINPSEAIEKWGSLEDRGADHYIWILEQAVGILIEKGIDKTSDPKKYKHSAIINNGLLTNSGNFSSKGSLSVMKEITSHAGGRLVTKYKLRDWVFSRQRYWGEPIPLIHCEKCGVVPVPEKELPVVLPKVKSYEPTGTGESPLAAIDKWVNVKCPECGGKGKRETNTMPQWAGSSWYYLRYMDPSNKKKLVDPKNEKYWSPVDLYVGGAEHATRHLIYARFWHKFLYDIGAVSSIEPFKRLQSVGLIMGEDGRKMSKRFGNVVNPDEIVKTYGADTLRLYEMFMGPFDQQIAWSTASMVGSRRFIERVWKMGEGISSSAKHFSKIKREEKGSNRTIHRTTKKVTEDIDNLRFNTAISTLMIALNELEKLEIGDKINITDFETYLQLLAPFAPHVTDELWSQLGHKQSIHISTWPTYDAAQLVDNQVTIMVQINGKTRGSFAIPRGTRLSELENKAKSLPETQKWLSGKEIKRVVVIPDRLVNIVAI